jgi:hypothetical protein
MEAYCVLHNEMYRNGQHTASCIMKCTEMEAYCVLHNEMYRNGQHTASCIVKCTEMDRILRLA